MAVLLACVAFLSALSPAQEQENSPQLTPRDWKVTKKKEQGPRALGLLQLSSNGKATLIPIAIRIDGKFYDASAYKADPVPMSLDSGTVYEGEQTGSSLGLFTINGALRSILPTSPHPWIGTGMWLPTGTDAPKTGIKAEDVPVGIETTDGPPRLTKSGSAPKGDSKTGTIAPSTPPATDSSAGSNPSGGSQPRPQPPKSSSTDIPKPDDKKDAGYSGSAEKPGDDTNRPRLRRGRPTEPLPADEDVPGYGKPKGVGSSDAKSAVTSGAKVTGAYSGAVQLIPAISDAGGPDPRSYTFQWDKSEEEERRKQMLAFAKDQIRAYVASQAKARIEAAPARPKTAAGRRPNAKPAQPELENVQLRTFDLWANNQPVLVLTAEAHMPPAGGATSVAADPSLQYMITLVARTDIYSNLHTLYAGVTDKYHLDLTPRLDLIDVVDADGDGRGELLFQQTTDTGSGYVIYRATADKLWKMFDSLNPE